MHRNWILLLTDAVYEAGGPYSARRRRASVEAARLTYRHPSMSSS